LSTSTTANVANKTFVLFSASRSIAEAAAGRAGRAFSNPCQIFTSFTSLSEQDIDLACPENYFAFREAGYESSAKARSPESQPKPVCPQVPLFPCFCAECHMLPFLDPMTMLSSTQSSLSTIDLSRPTQALGWEALLTCISTVRLRIESGCGRDILIVQCIPPHSFVRSTLVTVIPQRRQCSKQTLAVKWKCKRRIL
jgi:hypothetical protein